jgi:F0F1-type ATP synthase assembly protein I
MERKSTTPIQIGLIISLVLIVISVVLFITVSDLKVQQKFGYLSYAILIGGIAYACFNHAKENAGNVTFGNVFGFGFKTTAVITSIMVVFTILSVTLLFPEMKDKAMEMARQQMEEQGQLTETQIDQAIDMTTKFFVPFAIGGALIGYLIMGCIGSLIGAAIAKKNPNPTPFESDSLA